MKIFQRLFGPASTVVLSPEAENAIAVTADNSARMTTIFESVGRAIQFPLPVQTFPTTDDVTWEKEKTATAGLAERIFFGYEQDFISRFGAASDNVLNQTQSFFSAIQLATDSSGESRAEYIRKGLDSLLPCSPKKITAEFQKQALAAGWAYVSAYNCVIDKLAETYPRCRAGVFMSRLKYSDVIQIADEILTTLRACSTLMEDLQRRYDILEALQNGMQADLKTPESEKIWSALRATFIDTAALGKKDTGFTGGVKRSLGIISELGTGIGNALSGPQLQMQGQIQREQRVVLFFSTADMFQEGWREWQKASDLIIKPNLHVMFELKRDFFRNQVICLCDLITYNGYCLDGLPETIMAMCKGKLS